MRATYAAALLLAACNADASRGGKKAEAPTATAAEGGGHVAAPGAEELHVIDPGAEPRADRRYAFAAARPERRVLTMAQITEEQGAMSIALTVEVDAHPGKMQMKLLAVHVAEAPRELEEELARAVGTVGAADVSPRGDTSELALTPTVLRSEAAAEIVTEGMRQLADLLVVRLPDVPIGAGAKWETRLDSNKDGIRSSTTHRYQLTRVDGAGGTVVSDVSVELPKTPVPDRRPPVAIALSASGSYTWELRFDRVATRVDGSITMKHSIEVEGEPPRVQVVTSKHTVTTAD